MARPERTQAESRPDSRLRRGAPDVLACLLLTAFCLAVFWPAFAGRVLVPADGIYFIDPAFAPARPPDVRGPINTALTPDQMYVMYVWRLFTHDSLRAGLVPLWNPYAGCGEPFLANDQSAVLNPANLMLNLLLSPARAQTVFCLLCLVGAALFTYGLVRSLGAAPIGGVLAGLTFAFGGFIFIWLGYPLAATAAWLPALLWATHRLVLRPSAVGAVLLGGVIGWQFLAGHLSTSAQMLAFWLVFTGYEFYVHRKASPPQWAWRFLGAVALALVLGCGLGAGQLGPLRENFGLSGIAETGRSRWVSENAAENVSRALLGDWWFLRSVARGELALLFVPERHGNPTFDDYRQYPGYGCYPERTSYVGTVALFALLAGVLRPPRPFGRLRVAPSAIARSGPRWGPSGSRGARDTPSGAEGRPGYRRFFLAASWIMFGILLHLPILNIATYLPVLRFASPPRMRFIFALCAAVTLGLTSSDWLGGGGRRASACPSAALGVNGEMPALQRRRAGTRAWMVAVLLLLVTGPLAALTVPLLAPKWEVLSRGDLWLRLIKLFAPPAVAMLLAALLYLNRHSPYLSRAGAACLVLITMLDFAVFAARWHPMARAGRILPELPSVQLARRLAGGARISGQPNVFAPNIGMGYGLYDARAYEPIPVNRVLTLVETLTGNRPGRAPNVESPLKGSYMPVPALDHLQSVRCSWRYDPYLGVFVEPVSGGLPRAYVTSSVTSGSAAQALSALAAGLDPWETTFVEGPPRAVRSAPREPSELRPAQIVAYLPDRVVLKAYAEGPAWLVLTDTYFPGWRATVDGRGVPIAAANFAFRAVPLPAGESTVEMVYEPASYRLGLFLGLLSLMAAVGVLLGAAAARPASARRSRR